VGGVEADEAAHAGVEDELVRGEAAGEGPVDAAEEEVGDLGGGVAVGGWAVGGVGEGESFAYIMTRTAPCSRATLAVSGSARRRRRR
jgi:hypothetical protein